MPAYRDAKRGTWYVKFRYRNWKKEAKWVTKRGFSHKRDALQWEREFLQRQTGSLEMTFGTFVEVYLKDIRPRIKESTFVMKQAIIDITYRYAHMFPSAQKAMANQLDAMRGGSYVGAESR